MVTTGAMSPKFMLPSEAYVANLIFSWIYMGLGEAVVMLLLGCACQNILRAVTAGTMSPEFMLPSAAYVVNLVYSQSYMCLREAVCLNLSVRFCCYLITRQNFLMKV